MAAAIFETELDSQLKSEAERIFADAGLSIEEGLRRMLVRTVETQAVPLDLFEPSAETTLAMDEGRRGDVIHLGTVDALRIQLREDA